MKETGATSAHSSCCLNKEKFRHRFPRRILKVHLFLWRWEHFCYNMQIGENFGGMLEIETPVLLQLPFLCQSWKIFSIENHTVTKTRL